MSSSGLVGSLNFAVIHVGARLHYAVPAVLAEAGMLAALYTDAHSGSLPAKILRLAPSRLLCKGLRRLLSRQIPPQIPRGKIRSWVWPTLQMEWVNRRCWRYSKDARFWYARTAGGHWLAKRAIREKFGGANALYTHPCVATGAIVEARKCGLFVVVEAISHPFNKMVEREEYQRFSRVPPPDCDTHLIERNLAFYCMELAMADLVLAASPFVRDGLIELGVPKSRLRVVPYGLDSRFCCSAPRPQPGRVLYVGGINYLKGVPDLAAAARILRSQGFVGDIRAVGAYGEDVIRRDEFGGLSYTGQIPRGEVRKEYEAADVFVFPSLSDGFGMVQLEAMAFGVPVITTGRGADLVADGNNGFLVPPREPSHLADRIQLICSDRQLRGRLSAGARATAANYSLDAYKRRLLEALSMEAR